MTIGGLERLSARAVGSLAVLLILLAAALTIIDVFMRSILKLPLFGTNDVVIILLTVAVIGCFPYALSIRQHIQITLLGRALGPRGFWLLEFFANLVTLAVVAAFCWQFGKRALLMGAMHTSTQLLRIPLEPVWLAATAILALATLVQLAVAIRCARAFVRRDQIPADGAAGPD